MRRTANADRAVKRGKCTGRVGDRLSIYIKCDRLPVRRDGSWAGRDRAGELLPLGPGFDRGWMLAALGGGRPIALASEFDGDRLTPLGVWAEGRYLPLS